MKYGFFITGTDTEIGKTFCAAALLRTFQQAGFSTLAMKPVAAGLTLIDDQWINEDVAFLRAHANIVASLTRLNPYALQDAIAPHIAAARQGIRIEPDVILNAYADLCASADVILVEGVGGFQVPLSESYDTAQMARDLGLPVILVVGMRLGCLNHALLTARAIRAQNLPIAGWIANVIDPAMQAMPENIDALKQRLDAPYLGMVPHLADRNIQTAATFLTLEQLIKGNIS